MKMHKDFYDWFKANCSGKSKYHQLMELNYKCKDDYLGYYPAGSLNNWFADEANYVKCVRYIMNDEEPDFYADLGVAVITVADHDVFAVDNPVEITKRFEMIGKHWYVDRKMAVNGRAYYRIAPKKWISDLYVISEGDKGES